MNTLTKSSILHFLDDTIELRTYITRVPQSARTEAIAPDEVTMSSRVSLLVLLYSGLVYEAEGACHCTAGCDPVSNCTGACDTGWYGPYCQKQNVALNGSASQISTFHESRDYTDGKRVNFTADLAVDGFSHTDFTKKPLTCTHTGSDHDAWWRVKLARNGVNQIKHMTIYNRQGFERRRQGMDISVDGQRCYGWTKDAAPDTVALVVCDQTLVGEEVTIRIPGQFLSLCEVQVFVCNDFWYGEDCDKRCNCFPASDICDKGNGACKRGCQPGFTGLDCQQECEDGFYGMNCTSSCGQCLNTTICDKSDGHCPRGCQTGWTTVTCDRERDVIGVSVGGVLLVVVVVVVAVLVILIKRRKGHSRPAASMTLYKEPSVQEHSDACYDEDEVFSAELEDVTVEGASYCNWVSPCVSLEKLVEYIRMKKEDSAFETEYKAIPYGIRGSVEEGKRAENKLKNRFAALYPYDDSRVILEEDGENTSDYVNANYVSGHGGHGYIATQGPTQATVGDFWRMVWQQRVGKIVMVTQLKEMQKVKCEKYWPCDHDTSNCGNISIEHECTVTRADFTMMTLKVKHVTAPETRRVLHFQFLTWPDHGVPSAPALVSFWKRIKQLEGGEEGPLLVHCSAGVGRTGTFIALDYLMDQAEAEHRVNVFQCVSRMRQARMNMVQTVHQYEFLHLVVLEAVNSRGTCYTLAEFQQMFECLNNRNLNSKLKKEFKMLHTQRPHLEKKDVSDALLPENVPRNKTILPGNKSRPYLSTPVEGYNNYINAVLLPSVMRSSMLIATQTPMENTVVDFWRLVHDHDCFTIVCLDDSQDIEIMYPNSKGPLSMEAGPFVIEHSEERSMDSITERKLILNNTKQGSCQTITVLSLQSLSVCLSRDPDGLLELVSRVADVVCDVQHKVLVHCSDGARMCGVFCGVLNTISRLKLDSVLDIYLTIRELQLARPQFIQSFADYKYCYHVAREYICGNNVYANM
ncbi:receptor-type tyrosine-protein phosphatase epsilon-like [Haliotis rufescens]|uniref:receptor-type tyrosine-protein phosphatase epsilon-like n=1 Tax=Haliotis rufescens TaxID=6454 RepID=UPI00201F5004|nr:receptor-type tyrosine-protein phosphatase epsilon-like [Haliotis rufescens]